MRRFALPPPFVFLLPLLFAFLLPAAASAQVNRCEEPQGDTSATVPQGTPLGVGFCHPMRDAAGAPMTVPPVFVAVTAQGELTLEVAEIGPPTANGSRWFEQVRSTWLPSTQSVDFVIVARNAVGSALPSRTLSIAVTSTKPAVPAAVMLPRILR